MPPARVRVNAEDSKIEGTAIRDRASANAVTANRSRKTAAVTALAGNSSKDSASNTSSNAPVITSTIGAQAAPPGITWTSESPSLLHAYRTAYRLETPPSFHSTLNAAVLNAPGIGRHCPTMARRKEQRKVPKEQLALTVRKHFNGLAVVEADVLLALLVRKRFNVAISKYTARARVRRTSEIVNDPRHR